MNEPTLPIGTRVRLRAPHPMLRLRSDTGTVVRPDKWDGYLVVRLDEPAVCDDGVRAPMDLVEVCESADNLEPIG